MVLQSKEYFLIQNILNADKKILRISAPGRICLFGEHQDYLNLPVIAAAISKRVFIEGSSCDDSSISIQLPDINEQEKFPVTERVPYTSQRDYFRSAFNIVQKNGFTFSSGIECKVHGEIPINTGTASSSALVVAWVNFLTQMSDQRKSLEPELIAQLAYKAEVLEFSEPGGMMDHYSTSTGGVIHLTVFPVTKVEKLNNKLGAFVLSNSEEPKDTKAILARVKTGVFHIVEKLQKKYPDFSLQSVSLNSLEKFEKELSAVELILLQGTVSNKIITEEALNIFKKSKFNNIEFGNLLNKHQDVLRRNLKISTPKIDAMINRALDAGALGGKINGSGGGGCMFVYAPDNPEKVLDAVKKIAPDSYIVYVDRGTEKIN